MKEGKKLDAKGITQPASIEDCDSGASLISFVNDNYEISHSRSASNLTPTSSPHPPPRHRQNAHHKMPNSQSTLLQPNQGASRSKSSGNLGPTGQSMNSSPNSSMTYFSSRNKISFKDVHSGFGRPVLRDRNIWRYNRKSDTIVEVNTNPTETRRAIPEQNLLISL